MGFNPGNIGGGETSRGKENYDKTRVMYREQGEKLKHLYGQARKQLARGYGRAEEAISGIGNAERQSILNSQQQQIADMDQRMTSRGLYNTSIGVGGGTEYQGIMANTQQSLNDLSSRLASLYSNLYTSKGTEMAGLFKDKFQARQNWGNDRAEFLMGAPGLYEEGLDLYKVGEIAARAFTGAPPVTGGAPAGGAAAGGGMTGSGTIGAGSSISGSAAKYGKR